MKKLVLLLFVITFLSCNKVEPLGKNEFKVDATLKGIKDNSLAIITNENKIIDSARVFNEKVSFRGSISEPNNVVLRIDKTRNYKYFWLEANPINIIAEDGKFKEARITGSKLQLKDDEFEARIKPFQILADKIDSYAEKNHKSLTSFQIDSLTTIYNKAEKDEENETMSFIREESNSVLSAYLLDFYSTTFEKDSVKVLYKNLNDSLKESKYGNSIKKFLNLNKELKIGDKYADLSLKNRNNEIKTISEIKSNYLLIEFWASNCGPCRVTNPKLVKIYQKYKSKGFEIYGISLDTNRKDWIKALEKDKLPWENVIDVKGFKGESTFTYGINVIPDNFLIDQKGNIIARKLWSKELEKKLEKLLP